MNVAERQAIAGTQAAGAKSTALSHVRICDLTGLLAGAGATRFLAAFGAQVIRVEQPAHEKHRWDFLRYGVMPDGRSGYNLGSNFNNHNVEKLGITLDMKSAEGKALLSRLIAASDVLTENFSAPVMGRLGFTYERIREINEQIVYVSNSGFGKTGPYTDFKSVGQVVQAVTGLSFVSGVPEEPPAGWGFAYMDHHGAYMMAMAVLSGLIHRKRTGKGQWIDFSCTEAGIGLAGPELLDSTVNGRPMRRAEKPNSSRDNFPGMAPHGVYPAAGDDSWVAIACRDDDDWRRLAKAIGELWAQDPGFDAFAGRMARRDELERQVGAWTRPMAREKVEEVVRAAGVPVSKVSMPEDRIDHDVRTSALGLWPTVHHDEIGEVRVEGVPMHMSETDWRMSRGGPCLGADNDFVYGSILGLAPDEIADLKTRGVI
jgi:crotonobetainyl-CoA:carnitine CoA-transferase CaiB-like acyl-CoA transferase